MAGHYDAPRNPWDNAPRKDDLAGAPMICRVGFDLPDLRAARRRGDVVVLVDVLSFSTAVVTGAARGVEFLPAGSRTRAAALAEETGATPSVSRNGTVASGTYTLSPLSYATAPRGLRVVLRSPNGARLVQAARGAPAVIVGAFVNASAAGAAAGAAALGDGRGVTVVACGEREVGRDGGTSGGRRRVFAGEDFLGAGAVAAAVPLRRSGDAEAAVRAFQASRADLERILRATDSGRGLRAAGYEGDVAHAARVDLYSTVPVLAGGVLKAN